MDGCYCVLLPGTGLLAGHLLLWLLRITTLTQYFIAFLFQPEAAILDSLVSSHLEDTNYVSHQPVPADSLLLRWLAATSLRHAPCL